MSSLKVSFDERHHLFLSDFFEEFLLVGLIFRIVRLILFIGIHCLRLESCFAECFKTGRYFIFGNSCSLIIFTVRADAWVYFLIYLVLLKGSWFSYLFKFLRTVNILLLIEQIILIVCNILNCVRLTNFWISGGILLIR